MNNRMNSMSTSSMLINSMPMLIPALSACRNKGMACRATCKGRTRIRERIHADAEPRHTAASANADTLNIKMIATLIAAKVL